MRHIRKSRGLTQEELAKKMGISQPRLSKLEKGEHLEHLTIGEISKLAELLGICPVSLVCRLMNDINTCNVMGRKIEFENCYLMKKYHRFFEE